MGSLRLNICYTEDCVLPSEYYASLRNLLLKSSDVQVLLLKTTFQMKAWNGLCSPVWDHVWKYAKLESFFISVQCFCQNSLSNLQNTLCSKIPKLSFYFKRISKDSEVTGPVWLKWQNSSYLWIALFNTVFSHWLLSAPVFRGFPWTWTHYGHWRHG